MKSASIRPATIEDARALAELVNLASEGMAFYVWSKLAGPGEDPWTIGAARARREEGSFGYRNATVIDVKGGVAASLVGYALPDRPQPIDEATMPPMFVPLQQLENLAAGTWYVNVLASYPHWQKNGFGTALLQHAETLAAATGLANGMSVIVADNNTPARRLYERMGYRHRADRPMLKEKWQSLSSAWVLLVKAN